MLLYSDSTFILDIREFPDHNESSKRELLI
ncbi:unnamed protein product [Chondrus crispus]|uniref:Uncharacterized protein n=1 Tax=Chondrus crispus TaxID=2769 RepID=R7QAR6_CHOCR|nr:unnamed protein product [Chondrus crispus]CDF34888.1 unnamed protein product [Chondrus crispus]|eukprot:XP_005714707.1 unnamed protein product [Chondrus crispus]